ncbi:DUF6340 family protein [Viscerimonas tarda]
MKTYISCSLFLFFIALSSCSTIETIRISVEKPAQVTLPPSIRSIVIVNNAVQQPDSIGYTIVNGKGEDDVVVPSDSLNAINNMLTQALAQFMDDEKFFDKVTLFDKPLRTDNVFLAETLIDDTTIQRIAAETGADAVVSLDRFLTKIILIKQARYHTNLSMLEVKIQAKFRVYSNEGKLMGPPVSFNDTLYWNDANEYVPFPGMKEGLKQAALHTADKMVPMFIPYWMEQNRWYYTNSGGKMMKATQYAVANKWKEAALIWGEVYETEESSVRRAKLASNIALANEMLDDVENAMNWANISYNLFEECFQNHRSTDTDLFRIMAFRDELKRREADFHKLDKQKRYE